MAYAAAAVGRRLAAGLLYCTMPCCCGAPQAVRKVNVHLSKHGRHPTYHACCPCCTECQPKHITEFGKSETMKGEVASGSWWCYCCCCPCYIRSNRELFEKQHLLPGKWCLVKWQAAHA